MTEAATGRRKTASASQSSARTRPASGSASDPIPLDAEPITKPEKAASNISRKRPALPESSSAPARPTKTQAMVDRYYVPPHKRVASATNDDHPFYQPEMPSQAKCHSNLHLSHYELEQDLRSTQRTADGQQEQELEAHVRRRHKDNCEEFCADLQNYAFRNEEMARKFFDWSADRVCEAFGIQTGKETEQFFSRPKPESYPNLSYHQHGLTVAWERERELQKKVAAMEKELSVLRGEAKAGNPKPAPSTPAQPMQSCMQCGFPL